MEYIKMWWLIIINIINYLNLIKIIKKEKMKINKKYIFEYNWLLITKLILQQLIIIFVLKNITMLSFSILTPFNLIMFILENIELENSKKNQLKKISIHLTKKYRANEHNIKIESGEISILISNIIGYPNNKIYKIKSYKDITLLTNYLNLIIKKEIKSKELIKKIKLKWND